jgi:hypothetical protein
LCWLKRSGDKNNNAFLRGGAQWAAITLNA